ISTQGSFNQVSDIFRICGCSSPVNGFPGYRFIRLNESSSLERIYGFSHISLGYVNKSFVSVFSNGQNLSFSNVLKAFSDSFIGKSPEPENCTAGLDRLDNPGRIIAG